MTMKALPCSLLALLVASAAYATPLPQDEGHPPASDGSGELVLDRIVAVVDQQPILLSEVQRLATTAASTDRRAALDTLIAQRLIDPEVESLRIDVTASELDGVLRNVATSNGLSRAQLRTEVEKSGTSWETYLGEFRANLRRTKLIEMRVRSRVVVSDRDVEEELGRLAASSQHQRLRLRQILFTVDETHADEKAREAAIAARRRILNGEAFSTVARDLGADPSAKRGGDLGVVTPSDLLPALSAAAARIPPGSTSEPVRSKLGWHLILVEERLPLDAATRKQVRAKLFQERVEREFEAYVTRLKRDVYVEVREGAFSA